MHWIVTHASHLLYAAAGGVLTSTAEKAFSYNLIDSLVDLVKKVLPKSK